MSGEQLYSKLVTIGCPVSKTLQGNSFDYLFHDQAVLPFLDWICNYVDTSNVLHPEELTDYAALVESGVPILQGDELETALASFPQTASANVSEGDLKNEVRRLREEIQICDRRICLLESQKNVCTNEYNRIFTSTAKIATVISAEERKYEEAIQDCVTVGIQRNAILADLQGSGSVLCGIFDKMRVSDLSEYITDLKLNEFQTLEDEFNQRMKEYLQHQFFENIMNMSSGPDITDDYLVGLKVKDLSVCLVKGPKQEEYLFNCEEMRRLHSLYFESQLKLADSLVSQDQALACLRKIQILQKDIYSDSFCVSPSILRQRNRELANKLSILRMQVATRRGEIIQIINECADAERNKALTTDYSLKLMRQAYFNSKAKEALHYLWSQRARTELFIVLLDKQLEGHATSRNYLDATIEALLQEYQQNVNSKETLTRLVSPMVLDTVLESDNFTFTTLYYLLSDSSHQSVPKHSSILQSAKYFVDESAKLDVAITSSLDCQNRVLDVAQKTLDSLETAVFSDVSGGQRVCHKFKMPALPLTGLADIVCHLNQLKLKSQQLESEVKTVFSYYKDKQKILQTQPRLQEERRLFGLFYSRNPEALSKLSDKPQNDDSDSTLKSVV